MNGRWMPFWLAIVLVIGFPRLVFFCIGLHSEDIENMPNTQQDSPMEEATIQVLTDTGLMKMDLNDYLVGVLLCEIPGDFHKEAQKAQAIVARTYTMRTTQFKDKHASNAICTDPGCCQGYTDPSDYLLNGGNEARIALARKAVIETENQILTYEGELIDATYFSCSGGKTEDALAVWGVDIPYLQSVPSPGEENVAYYWDSCQFSYEEFQYALGQKIPDSPDNWFGAVTYTKGGGVESMMIGGRLYSGTELRSILGLRSTAFSITVSDEVITVTTRGFGHRVGMSQYGAQAMALRGKCCAEILEHYYPGAVIDKARFIS